ncbi:Sugar phosphate permease [Sphingobium faniae]|nr:Sugar phosphate permease [Sphingobium faniae]
MHSTMDRTGGGDVASSHRWRSLAIFTAVYVCQQYDRAIMAVVQEPVKHAFDLSDTQIGVLGGLAHGGMYALVGLPMGMLLDRFNRRNLLAAMLIIWSATTALGAFATGFVTLLLCRMMVGAAESGGYPALFSLTADIFPRRQHGTAMGILGMGSSGGIVLTLLVGGILVEAHGWQAGFLTAGVPGVLLALLLLWCVREPPRGDKASGKPRQAALGELFRFILSQRSMTLCMIGATAASAVLAGFWAWAISFMARLHDLSIAEVGFGLAIGAGLAGMTGSLLGGVLADRVGARDPRRKLYLIAFASLTCVPVGLAALMTESSLLAFILLPVFLVLGAAYTSVTVALVANLTTSRLRGSTLAVMSILNNAVGAGSGPLLVGMLSDGIGGEESLRYALMALVCVFAAAVTCFLAAAWTLRADLDRAAAIDDAG